MILPKSQAEAICQKWLDGLIPLFDQEPEMVLQELVESNTQPIQFLLHQLATNEQDRERFNKATKIFHFAEDKLCVNIAGIPCDNLEDLLIQGYEEIVSIFIRTCLSRVNGEAVLRVFDTTLYVANELLTDCLYFAFDYELRNGKPLDTALQTLHNKMLELVPEYQEFLKNNK
jgi:hypothetical protein